MNTGMRQQALRTKGIRDFDVGDLRFRLGGHRLAVSLFLCNPDFNQFLCGSERSLNAVAVRCQIGRRDMGIVVTLKFGLGHRFEKHGVAHDEEIFNTPFRLEQGAVKP
jgi:hypothetical protein